MKYTNFILTVIAVLLVINCFNGSIGSLFSSAKATPSPIPTNVQKVILCDEEGHYLKVHKPLGDQSSYLIVEQKK